MNSSLLRCDYTAKKKIYFEDHMSGGLKFVKCPWCDAHFKHTAKGKLGRHLNSEHNVSKVCIYRLLTY